MSDINHKTFEDAIIQLDELMKLGTRLSVNGKAQMTQQVQALITHSLMLPWPLVLAWARLRRLGIADFALLLVVVERASSFILKKDSPLIDNARKGILDV